MYTKEANLDLARNGRALTKQQQRTKMNYNVCACVC